MKKFYIFALVAMLFAACATDGVQDPSTIIPDLAPETLTVSFEGEESRIQLQESKTVWNEGDLVSVFYRSNANQKWQFQGATGDRNGNLKRVEVGTATETMNRVVVVYPYAENYYINPETYNVEASLPAEQTYIADSYGVGGNIMVSSGEYNQVVLKSVCGWLKLQLTSESEKIKSITLKGNNGEQVAGQLYINSADATATLASEMGGAEDDGSAGGNLVFEDTVLTEVTLNCGEGVELSTEPTAFYIALPPQTFAQGFSLEITDTNGSKMTKSTENEVVIERNTILPMAEFEYIPQSWTEIYYTATAQVVPDSAATFGANIVSNEWNSETGEGVISFDGKVTSIGANAFYGCNALESIIIPDSATSIGQGAFYGCGYLTSATIGKSVTSIEYAAFENCISLTSITIPDNLTSFSYRAFCTCIRLKSVYFSDLSAWCKMDFKDGSSNPLSYGAALYINNTKVTELTIPSDITEIKANSFIYCSSLKSVTIPDNVTSIGLGAFSSCKSLTSVTIGNGVASIDGYAFNDCSNLTSVTIPDSVTSIGVQAFNGCSNLKEVYCQPTTPPTGGESMFDGNASERNIYVPTISVETYKAAEYWSNYADRILSDGSEIGSKIYYTSSDGNIVTPYAADVFGANIMSNTYENGQGVISFDGFITSIGQEAFYKCTTLTSITIPDSVTLIEKFVFYDCTNLTSITIPDSVTSIGAGTFSGCSSLSDVTISKLVTSIENATFRYCSSLTSITIPDSVTSIGDSAFNNCSSLTSVTIGNNVTSIGDSAFSQCYNLESITIPDSVTSIGNRAFDGCSDLTSVTISNSITEIGNSVFFDCGSLISVTIPDSVTSIGDGAFENCNSLTSVTIPDSVTEIGEYAFYDCSSLTSATIGNGVISIGYQAFYGCSSLTAFYGKFASEDNRCLIVDGALNYFAPVGLTEYTIPNNVTSIGAYAFFYCSSLISVTIPDSVTAIGDQAFCGCSSLTSVYCKPTTPPTGNAYIFNSNASDRKIYVPASDDDSIINAYKAKQYWSNYADYIEEYDFSAEQ